MATHKTQRRFCFPSVLKQGEDAQDLANYEEPIVVEVTLWTATISNLNSHPKDNGEEVNGSDACEVRIEMKKFLKITRIGAIIPYTGLFCAGHHRGSGGGRRGRGHEGSHHRVGAPWPASPRTGEKKTNSKRLSLKMIFLLTAYLTSGHHRGCWRPSERGRGGRDWGELWVFL